MSAAPPPVEGALPDDLAAVLRVAPEPYVYLDEASIHVRLSRDPRGYLAYVRAELAAIAAGATALELPAKQLFTDPGGGDFRVMPCVVRGPWGVRKTVKLVGTNLAQRQVPDQITVGKAFALDPVENFVTHVFEACLLSSARTGACAALAADLLAPRRRHLTVVGAGRVGWYAAFYIAALGGVEAVSLCDADPARAAAAAAALARRLPGVTVRAQPWRELGACDVLVLATASETSLYGPDDFPAQLVVSLGADSDRQHELDPAWAGRAELYADTLDSLRYGDLRAWTAAGWVDPGTITDLLGLLRDGVPASNGCSRLFISTGSALLDNVTIGYLLDA